MAGSAEEYYNASSPDEQKRVMFNVERKLQMNAALGVIGEEDAQRLKEGFKTSVYEGQVDRDIESIPALALNELKKGKEGAYADLPWGLRSKKIDQAEKKMQVMEAQRERQEVIYTEAQEHKLLGMLKAGQLNERIVRAQMKTNSIRKTYGDALIRQMQSPKAVKAVTDMGKYTELLDLVLDPGRDIADVREKILDAQTSGKLSNEDFKFL
jgi:predicted acylesterase/phospholipase RssA